MPTHGRGSACETRIVLSGVNFVEGGPLSVFKDALQELADHYASRYEIVALVHRQSLFDIDGVTYIEFPHVKSSWLRRLHFEYWSLRALSRRLRPYLWLSMHDMTPNVTAEVRAVYCHNPSPFYRLGAKEALTDWKFSLFTFFYRYLYAINLRRNDLVIVQQEWLRGEFRRQISRTEHRSGAPTNSKSCDPSTDEEQQTQGQAVRFLYPTYPRSFKNVELLLEAARILEQRGVDGFTLWLQSTAARIGMRRNSALSMAACAPSPGSASCLAIASFCFMRKPTVCCFLPSWRPGACLFQNSSRQASQCLLIDLPYAHETVGRYPVVSFFPPGNRGFLRMPWKASSRDVSHLARPPLLHSCAVRRGLD